MIPNPLKRKKDEEKSRSEPEVTMGLPIGKEALEQVLSPEPILKPMAWTLMGLQPNPLKPDHWSHVEEKRKPLMNEKGIAWALAYARAYVNVNTFLSVYDKFQIEYKLRNLHVELALELYQRNKEFDIEPQHLDTIVTTIVQGAQSALLRALDGRTLDMVAKVFQISQKMGDERRKGDRDW